jgi:hypothetical protein
MKGTPLNKHLLGSIILLGAALTVAAVTRSRGDITARASHPGAVNRGAAAATDRFLSGRAGLPQ